MSGWNERRFAADEEDESPFLMEALSSPPPTLDGGEEREHETVWPVPPASGTEGADVADEQEVEGFASHATEEALARLEPLMEAESPDEDAADRSTFSPSVIFESPVGGVQPAWRAAFEKGVLLADIAAGQRSENDLTNKIFFLRHPEKKGTRIGAGEEALKREWLHIRDRQVIPCLLSGPYIGPMHARTGGAPPPELRKGVPADAVISPLAITLRGLRAARQRQPGTIASIVLHMTSRGPAKRSKAAGYRTPAVQYALNHYINGAEGFPHYVIDFNGTIYATCDERFIAHHAGWIHPGGKSLFTSGWRAPEWWSRVWFKQGVKTPVDLLPPGAGSPNSRTLGIELLILPDLAYTSEQYRALARLIVDIRQRNAGVKGGAIPSRALLGHEDFAPVAAKGGRADARGGWDPGAHRQDPYFDWQRLAAEIQEVGGAATVQEIAVPIESDFEVASGDAMLAAEDRLDDEGYPEIPFAGETDEADFEQPDEESVDDDSVNELFVHQSDGAMLDQESERHAGEALDDAADGYSSMEDEQRYAADEDELPYAESEDDAELLTGDDQPQSEDETLPVVWAGLRQRIVSAATSEWNRWAQGNRNETEAVMRDALRAYWRNVGLSESQADAKVRQRNPWSAAFISWVMTIAGAGAAFKKSAAHYSYVAAAKRNRIRNDESNPFWAYRITEVAPQPGDLVCKARKPPKSTQCSSVSYDNVDNGSYWAAHCDVVTDVGPNAIITIGGNVNNSVAQKTIPTDARGFLPEKARDGCRFIAVLKVRDGSTAVSPGPPARPDDGGTAAGIAALPKQIASFVQSGALALKVALAMAAGERDAAKLTSMLFFIRHPERAGARIRPEEKQLAREWLEIRDRIVEPALERLSASTPPAAVPSPLDANVAGGATAAPVGPFGTLTIQSPDRLRLQYQFTAEDVLWTARLVEGEAGGEDNAENVAVVWALVNRFGIFRKDLPDRTFADFIRRYSTTLQPYLRNPDAISRAMETSRQNPGSSALRWVDLGGTFSYKGKAYPRGQYQKHLTLQAKPWNQLKKGARLVAERVLGGHVASPIGIASDFDGTHIFLNRSLRKSGRNPSTIPADEYRRLWVEFTLQHAKKKNRTWIGEHVPGLRQMKSNVFYIHPRSKDLPADTVRIVPVRGH
jgi:N-acetyl-anhydromuramyl-L-alanine amidase AmpD